MENIILIFVCLILGIVLQRVKDFPTNGYKALNQFVIYISLPALALYYIPKITLSSSLLYPLSIAWIGFGFSFLFFSLLQKIFGWSKKLTGCLILTSGLGNTSFVGFPIIEALYGKEGLQTAIIVDQPGTFVALATVGVLVASLFSRGETTFSSIAKKILTFPPFIAFTIALLLNIFKLNFDQNLDLVFQRLGSTVTPVALVAVGLQLKIEKNSKHWKFLLLGLSFKLFIMPALFFVVYYLLLKQQTLEIQISILEAAMAPMITAAILASTSGLKPKLSSMMIGIGIPISFITVGLWYFLFQLV